jgi:hypothetical protein
VSCSSGTPWVDNGQNYVDRIYNQATGTWTEPINNYNKEAITSNIAGGYRFDLYTPSSTYAEATIGGSGTSDWIGFVKNGSLVPWFVYPATGGFQFQSLSTFRGSAIPDGSIVNHHWCIGRYCTAPPTGYTLQILDQGGVASTLNVQVSSGQGTGDLAAFTNVSGSRMSGITYQGSWDGALAATAFTVNGANGHALCKKASDGTFGTCSTVVASDGSCTCN